MSRSPITTHVLNLDSGRPAEDVAVTLFRLPSDTPLASARTDSDGRVVQWSTPLALQEGTYRLQFDTGAWFEAQGKHSFYPGVVIDFAVTATDEHYHVPLLLNAHGYSTYRGS
ncbi:hydroxyisourate hydrolase [Marinimicrobium sp. ARAG 43.8]|uniref:hydroxyisourate hydrolase n=1 Tax=Marinimicrobium sp. ARAG 43.8 TaxID=3418719 RepID=UPI003CED5830